LSLIRESRCGTQRQRKRCNARF